MLFNVVIIFIAIYLSRGISLTGESADNKTINQLNIDSINKANNVKVIEIDKIKFDKVVDSLSSNKKLAVVFYTSWCKNCPNLIKAISQAQNDTAFDFNAIYISLDRPNKQGILGIRRKAAILNMKNEIYYCNSSNLTDITNFKAIETYIPNHLKYEEELVGLPYYLIYSKGKIVYESVGYNEVWGLSKWIDLAKK